MCVNRFQKDCMAQTKDLDENQKGVMKACSGFGWTCFLNVIYLLYSTLNKHTNINNAIRIDRNVSSVSPTNRCHGKLSSK